MYNELIKKLIKLGILDEKLRICKKRNIMNNNDQLLDDVIHNTRFLQENATPTERLFCICNNITSRPLCNNCDKPIEFKWHKYATFCSHKCSNSNSKLMNKRNKTITQKYNGRPFTNPEVQNKIKQTNLDRLGVEYPLQSEVVQNTIKQTNLDRLGVKYPFQSNVIRTKQKQTIVDIYGVDNPLKDKLIQQKSQNTIAQRYDNGHHTRKHIPSATMDKLNDKDWLLQQHHDFKKSILLIARELGIHDTTVHNYIIQHGIEQRYYFQSRSEVEIGNFIASLGVQYQTGVRNIIRGELDIYIPEFNIAIEYNGLYWHSEAAGKTANYHLRKTQLCEEQGIRLIHIFEDEWRDQQQKCKDTIQHLLGKSPKGIYARQTTIKEIPWKTAKDFLNQYHLLNAGVSGNYRIGAFDKKTDELIGVMVFGQSTSERTNEIELKRFVTNKKNNPGLGSKMFKYAVKSKGYQEVIAFVDRRWFTGLVKSYIGFERVQETEPALWWTNAKERHHRRWKTKAGLIEEGVGTSADTKVSMMDKLGYSRIWDSGKIKLKWSVN